MTTNINPVLHMGFVNGGSGVSNDMTPADSWLHPIFYDEERAVTPVMIIILLYLLTLLLPRLGQLSFTLKTEIANMDAPKTVMGLSLVIFVGAKHHSSLSVSTERTMTATRTYSLF